MQWKRNSLTNSPPVSGGDASFFFLTASRFVNNQQHFIQGGWANIPSVCGSDTQFYFEWTADGNNYHPVCGGLLPTTPYPADRAFWFDQDLTNGYWCAGTNGNANLPYCALAVSESDLGFIDATNVIEYGETTDTTVQMGGSSSSNPAFFDATQVAQVRGGNLNVQVTSTGTAYAAGNCPPTYCPYHDNSFLDSQGDLAVTIWTGP